MACEPRDATPGTPQPRRRQLAGHPSAEKQPDPAVRARLRRSDPEDEPEPKRLRFSPEPSTAAAPSEEVLPQANLQQGVSSTVVQRRRMAQSQGQKRAREDEHQHDHDHSFCNGQHRTHQPKPKLPVTVLTGYLGAGKTTLLNYVLREQRNKKLAVIENEVGEVSIDDALVQQKHEDSVAELIVLNNGCICCTIRQDLVTTLLDIATKYQAGQIELDGILIELTGVADPAPVVQTFFMHNEVRQNFAVDNVVALVDAKHAIEKLDESRGDPEGKGTACAQIAFSSTVLLNKIDLAEEAQLKAIEGRIKQLNSTVNIIRCKDAVVNVNLLFNVGAFNLGRVLDEQYMDEEEFKNFYQPKMDHSVSNIGIRCPGAVVQFLFQRFLDTYLGTEESATNFLRIKAVLNIAGSQDKYVLQAVHMLRNQGFTEPWRQGEQRENKIIFIGRGMQARRQELTDHFKTCFSKPLRFDVGKEVQAKTGDGDGEDAWDNGYIVAHWDDCNPYCVRLLAGGEVQAPCDDDRFVREA